MMTRLRDVNHEPVEAFYRRFGHVVHAVMTTFVDRDWRGQDKVPQHGGVIFAPNHISYADPLVVGEFLIYSGRWPRMLGKDSLFRAPVVGWLARGCGQIPVRRGTEHASDALAVAGEALAAGKAVVIYPEGSRTEDPDVWPMGPRTGLARLALSTRTPVIPIGQFGAQEILRPKELHVPKLFPRKTMHVLCGDPVDLSDLYAEEEPTREQVVVASERIMAVITHLVEQIRQSPAPADRFNQRSRAWEPRPASLASAPVRLG